MIGDSPSVWQERKNPMKKKKIVLPKGWESSPIEKLKEQFNLYHGSVQRLLKAIDQSKSNDILASMIIERRGQKIKKLNKDIDYIANNNDELRDEIDRGMKDQDYIPRKVADHKQKNQWDSVSVGGGKIKEVKLNQYENVRNRTWKELTPTAPPTIELDDILKLCSTDKQRRVAKFYYDKNCKDTYDSYQGTANWEYPGDEDGRQKVYSIIKRIKAKTKEKANELEVR